MIRALSRAFSSKKLVESMRLPLSTTDSEVHSLIRMEKDRQENGINLIASENYCSNACFAAVGSVFSNKYSQGYPGARYYGGTEHVDKLEILCQQRALKAFHLDSASWGVNVQALSGSPANMAVYTGLLNPYDRIMSLDLPHGGHLSHGFSIQGKKISAISKYFEILPYRVNEATDLIDYEQLHKLASLYRPRLIVAGASAYSRLIDYGKFRQICDEIGAYLLADMAHPAGLVAAEQIPSPFLHADVVTTTTHKTLRGPRGALIFYRVGSTKDQKGNEVKYDLKSKIDSAVFPGLQGGPHNHTIAGIAVALAEVAKPEFKLYQTQVLKNIRVMSEYFMKKGYRIVSGGTDNHLFVIDMRSKGVDGGRMEAVMNHIGISINKNTVPGDKSALIPSGIRIGSPAMTTRGCIQSDFMQIAEFIEEVTAICIATKAKSKGTKLKDFNEALEPELKGDQIRSLKEKVRAFAQKFQVPGGLI